MESFQGQVGRMIALGRLEMGKLRDLTVFTGFILTANGGEHVPDAIVQVQLVGLVPAADKLV